MSGLQPFLIAGVPQQLAITARDAQGNLTAGTDCIEAVLDSTAGGMLQPATRETADLGLNIYLTPTSRTHSPHLSKTYA